MNRNEQLALAAGHFNGEGSFSMNLSNGYPRPRITMSQRDPWLPTQFRDAVGMGKVYGPYSRGQWVYELAGADAVEAMKLISPWLSPPKRQQFRRALGKYGWRANGRQVAYKS